MESHNGCHYCQKALEVMFVLHCDLGTFRHRPKKVCYYDNLMIPIHKHLVFAISEEFLSVLNKRIILKQQKKKNNNNKKNISSADLETGVTGN